MQHASKRRAAKGFTLLETMIALLVLFVGDSGSGGDAGRRAGVHARLAR